MAKVYQVEKQKKIDRRKVKEDVGYLTGSKKVEVQPVVEKVVESGEIKANPAPEPKKPVVKKKKQLKKKEK